MNGLVNKYADFSKVEFWATITLFVFMVFFYITDSVDSASYIKAPNKRFFDEANINFDYYSNYFFPQLLRSTFLFLAFLLLNFVVVPRLIRKQALARNVMLVLLTLAAAGLVLGVTDTYLKNYLFDRYESEQEAYNSIFKNSYLYAFWLLLMLGLYTAIKYLGVYLLSNTKTIQSRYSFITSYSIAAFVLWMIGIFLLLIAGADGEVVLGLGLITLFGIMLYSYSFYSLIPAAFRKKKAFLNYIGRVALVMLISFFPVALFLMLFIAHEEVALSVGLFNTAFQLLITAPLSWVLYKRQLKGNEEIFVLKTALGQSNANFDFLRSQINPHFLFNALNTIYGTAIQEKAERTSEGVERLGDMMRFMLQENMQDKIPLAREIEYLNNYMSLQKLRTDPNPCVKIMAEIEEPLAQVQIAPMLLIPFVENAFKHGISFREPSHIKVNLEVREHKLYFDVYNSKHQKQENDPEKSKSGIGLLNVKQRLQLLYPARHELIIRETGKEFFVHLTIQLH
ncbi:histidine kinase internal subunit [Flammeovirgaceae bacterium 311]|nr:histidine kinase internal subunit [Flammeovirgaceae bacterium 311]